MTTVARNFHKAFSVEKLNYEEIEETPFGPIRTWARYCLRMRCDSHLICKGILNKHQLDRILVRLRSRGFSEITLSRYIEEK